MTNSNNYRYERQLYEIIVCEAKEEK